MANSSERTCETCGRAIVTGRDMWALDKHGDALCRECQIQAVLLLKAKGIDWEGQTFGYELGSVEKFDSSAAAVTNTPVTPSAFTSTPKVGRNERCPCGSGKKFKRCCGQ